MNEYLVYAIVAVLLVVCGYVAFAEGYQDKVYRIIYKLVCNAEEEITGTKKGQERKEQVVKAIHDWLPPWARIFVTEQDIDDLIELAVTKMKQLLDEEATAREKEREAEAAEKTAESQKISAAAKTPKVKAAAAATAAKGAIK